jgi:hypothetical protein
VLVVEIVPVCLRRMSGILLSRCGRHTAKVSSKVLLVLYSGRFKNWLKLLAHFADGSLLHSAVCFRNSYSECRIFGSNLSLVLRFVICLAVFSADLSLLRSLVLGLSGCLLPTPLITSICHRNCKFIFEIFLFRR